MRTNRRNRTKRPNTADLRRLELFDGVDAEQLDLVAAHTDVVRLPAGRHLARAGQMARQFVAIVDGAALEIGPDGDEQLLGAGADVGGRELLAGTPHDTTVVTRTETTVVVIEGPTFRWCAREIPSVAARFSLVSAGA
jgi:CRP-like cAMP-binding protein